MSVPLATSSTAVVVHTDPTPGPLDNHVTVGRPPAVEPRPPATVTGIGLWDRVVCIGQDAVLIAGGGVSEGVTIYTAGWTALPSYVPITAGIIGALLIGYPIWNCTFGSWGRTSRIITNITGAYTNAYNHFQRLLPKEQAAEGRIAGDVRADAEVVAGLANVAARSNTDAVELAATVNAGHEVANSLDAVNVDLRRSVAEESEESKVLNAQITVFSSKIAQLHSQLEEADKTIPQLRDINFSMEGSVSTFESRSEKILAAFSALILQVKAHAATISGLTDTVKGLQSQLALIQTTLQETQQGNADLEAQIQVDATRTAKLSEMNSTLTSSIEALTAQVEVLKKRESELVADRGNEFTRLTQAMQQTTSALNAPSDISHVVNTSAAANTAARAALEDSDDEERKDAKPIKDEAV